MGLWTYATLGRKTFARGRQDAYPSDMQLASAAGLDITPLGPRLDAEIHKAREAMRRQGARDPEDFDIRGGLYALAGEIAPNARDEDISALKRWIGPRKAEISIDIAAGTGFLSKHVAHWTEAATYAIDPSRSQLDALKARCAGLPVIDIQGSLSEPEVLTLLQGRLGTIDFITSTGGIHHIIDEDGVDKQREMFANASRLLKKGGRFVASDVCAGTTLAAHFEMSVKKHCLTGHHEKWLSPARLQGELIAGTDLEYVRSEVVPLQWVFNSESQMALFMKGLHAYDLTEEEILADLQEFLGYETEGDQVVLHWPLLFFHLRKR